MDKFVVIDLETTGHSPTKNDKIIDLGIVIIENDKITSTYTSLLNPGKSIPSFITNLTGISNDDVRDAPLFHEKADKIIELFEDSYLIAHNVPFDLGFLNAELKKSGKSPLKNAVLDTVELSRILYPKAPSYKLSQLTEYLQIHHEDPHRALSDAYVTAKLFLKLKKKLESLPFETIIHLQQLEKMLKSDLYSLLKKCEDAMAFSDSNNQHMIQFNGLAFRAVEEDNIERKVSSVSFGDYIDDIYEKDGTLEQYLTNYEKRTGQKEMSETIYDAFQTEEHALIEAETGTGKSLAYLLPAVYEAVQQEKRIVISTYTTQLQTQLLEEDIPLVSRIVPFSFEAVLLKGKNHYISLEKFVHELANDQLDNYDIVLTKAILLIWLTETKTGDIDEIQLPSSGYFFFNKISADAEGQLDPYSSWFKYSHYQNAKKRAQRAHIIITNHALLCTDMFNDYQFLPGYDKAIIDEAHHLEETASHHYGLKADNISMQYILNRIGRSDENKALSKILSNYNISENDLPVEEWDELISKTKEEIDIFFQTIYDYVWRKQKNNQSLSDIGRVQYRFSSGEETGESWESILEMVRRVIFHYRDLIHMLTLVEAHIAKNETIDKYDKQDILNMIEVLQDFIDKLEQLFLIDDQLNNVNWIETETKGMKNAVYLYSEPTNISSLLHDDFFDKKQSVILTSATLTMKDSFSFIEKRLGLPADRLISKKIHSPFSYKDQVQLLIPNDFPDIKYGNMDDFIFATSEALLSLAEITEGRMLVLFTSYDMLRKSYKLLKEIMNTDQYILIGQGITSGSRARLKKSFESYERAILLGTSSFWEGVDIPGEALSSLVIVRLPFQPPGHPVFEAKAKELKDDKRNPFMELSLPNAVIRFKQGFGRLIRSANDRGIVFVCDARLKQARYGKYFINSIPEVPVTYDSTSALINKAKEWF